MSDIPEARRLLQFALIGHDDDTDWQIVTQALALLDRKKPEFVAPRKVRKLSPYNREYARMLRSAGMSLNEIALKLKSNIGRVSEACQ
jgi:hypothetical protein